MILPGWVLFHLAFLGGFIVAWFFFSRKNDLKLWFKQKDQRRELIFKDPRLAHWSEALPLAIFIASPKGKILFANSTSQKLFQRASAQVFEDLCEGRVPNWVFPEDASNVLDLFSALRGLTQGTLESRIRLKSESGEILWLQVKLTAVAQNGSASQIYQPIGQENDRLILGTCEDVTLFQTAIHALRDREARTKRLLSGVRDAAILVLCEEGFIQFCNDAVVSVLGYSQEELKGSHISVLSPRTELLSGQTINSLAQADKLNYHEETTRRIRKSGEGFWANVLVTSLPSETPYSKNFCVVIRDVSAYKREEKELHEWKKRFEQLAENVKEAFWIYDVRAASLVYISPVFQPLLGLEPAVGQAFFSEVLRRVHPTDLSLARSFLSDLTLGHDSIVEFRVQNKTGETQWLSLKSFAVRDSSGRVYRVVGVAEDVTENKIAQLALREAKEAADAANQAKSEFLANMSHEIRTPLGAIMGFAELVGNFQNSEEERQSALQAILRNGKQLAKIIDEILDLSKVEAGKLEVEEEDLELLSFIEDVTTLLSLQAREKAVALRLENHGLLPKSIRADGTKLRQILINIIGNAVKFTDRGEVKIEVSTELHPRKSILKVKVIDTGLGLTEEQKERLFQPFVQADSSTRRRFGGTGLGLVLSRRLANLLGGNLQLLWSAQNQGSCFEISLPIGPAKFLNLHENNLAELKKLNRTHVPSENIRIDGKRVLVVDDAPDNRLIVQRFLTHAGAVVDHAEDGRSGARLALENCYDVVVMDIQMPDFDGYETIRYLRSKGFRKPAIALSAHAMREDRERSLAAGFDEHLSKPINRHELLLRIDEVLRTVNSFLPDYEMQ